MNNKKTNVLIVEDSKDRIKQFDKNFKNVNLTFAETNKQAINYLSSIKFDYMFLDHDLSGEDTMEIAKWLLRHKGHIPGTIYIHSVNPVGTNNLIGKLKKARKAPMIWKKNIDFNKIY